MFVEITLEFSKDIDPDRRYGEGGGRGVQDWELMYTRGGFILMAKPIQYCKVK